MDQFKDYYYYERGIKPYKIYCDMDGVIVDWESGFALLSPNKTYEEYEAEGKTSHAWHIIHKAKSDWWENLLWLDDGKKLWDYIKKYNPTILSSPGTANIDTIKNGKIEWIKRELGEDVEYIIERKKEIYAKDEYTILIDDTQKKIDNWVVAGGKGILHKSANQTIEELKELGL